MIQNENDIGKFIGLIVQISDNKNLQFIVNSSASCSIGDIVTVITSDNYYVLGEIFEVKFDFYLENHKQYFISKAVENNIDRLNEAGSKPRYGQYITARILGYYSKSNSGRLSEVKSAINHYTPQILQRVYSLDLKSVAGV